MNNKVIIVWKPDVLSMVEHAGNNDNYKGLTARSQVESFSNIKTVDAAKRLILTRLKFFDCIKCFLCCGGIRHYRWLYRSIRKRSKPLW